MMRAYLLALPLLLLAGCGGGDDVTVENTTPAGPPAALVTPPSGQQWVDVVERTPEGGYRMGNPNAPVKLIEYGSRTCPHCADYAAKSSEPLKAKYIATGKVSFEFRDFLRNGADLAASLLGQCAGPATFFPILEQMMAEQESVLKGAPAPNDPFYKQIEGATPARQPALWAQRFGYLDFVKQRGVPEAQAQACLADTKASEALVKANEDAAKQFNIQGTPTFLINGEVLANTGTWEQVEQALVTAGAR